MWIVIYVETEINWMQERKKKQERQSRREINTLCRLSERRERHKKKRIPKVLDIEIESFTVFG